MPRPRDCTHTPLAHDDGWMSSDMYGSFYACVQWSGQYAALSPMRMEGACCHCAVVLLTLPFVTRTQVALLPLQACVLLVPLLQLFALPAQAARSWLHLRRCHHALLARPHAGQPVNQ